MPTPPAATDCSRRRTGLVGVDSGTMCIAAPAAFTEEIDIWFSDLNALTDGGITSRSAAVSSSGVGDGSYDVLEVIDPTGAVAGIEVVFLCPDADAVLDEALRDAGLPGFAWWNASEQDRVRYEAVADDIDTRYKQALTTTEPWAGTVCRHVGTFDVPGTTVGVGDPCYGTPTLELPAPAARLEAFVYVGDYPPFGVRVFRLGAYRVGFMEQGRYGARKRQQ